MNTIYQYNLNSNVSFGMLKKSQLTPLKRIFCEMYHPPLEKMNSTDDLFEWAEKGCEKLREPNKMAGIEYALKPWKECLQDIDVARQKKSTLWHYFILDTIKKMNTTFIVFPDMDVIVDTITRTKAHLQAHPDKFNFYKEYSHLLKEKTLNKYFPDGQEKTGWINFVGQTDPKKQEELVKDIRALSVGTNWCTLGSLFSKLAIENENCGFHIFIKDGKTLLGVRTVDNLTEEIRDERNIAIHLKDEQIEELKKINPKFKVWMNDVSMLD